MKKAIIFLMIIIMLMFSGCVNWYPLDVDGTYESEDPKMVIHFDSEGTDYGTFTDENGNTKDIVVDSYPGRLAIFYNRKDSPIATFYFKKKRNKLVLEQYYGELAEKIVLIKVSD